jgi:ABC-2 type transport system permease protein
LTAHEAPVDTPTWREPWRTGGLIAALRRPRLLWHLVRVERGERFQGTLLGGIFWQFAQPITKFFMYLVVVGIVLGLSKRVDNFAIYVYCGVIMVQLFNAAMKSGTKSMARSTSLLRRVNLPRELVPMTAVLAQILRLGPATVVLFVVAIFSGWRPNHLVGVPYALGGILLVTTFLVGLGLILSVANTYVRDVAFGVELAAMMTHWISPVLYPLDLVTETLGNGPLYTLFLANPLTIAMMGLRETFWAPTVSASQAADIEIPGAALALSVVISLATLLVGLAVVHRYSHRLVLRGTWKS